MTAERISVIVPSTERRSLSVGWSMLVYAVELLPYNRFEEETQGESEPVVPTEQDGAQLPDGAGV
mgnify:CR=1 FL=1